MRCRKYSCRTEAVRFFSFNRGRDRVALCSPCAEGWLRDQPNFCPIELTEAEYLELLEVAEVMES